MLQTLQRPQAAPVAETDSLPVTVIERAPGWRFVDGRELWRYRELLFFLTWRDVKVRCKHTALGAAWAVLQPFGIMIVLSIFPQPGGGAGRPRSTIRSSSMPGSSPGPSLPTPSTRPARALSAVRIW